MERCRMWRKERLMDKVAEVEEELGVMGAERQADLVVGLKDIYWT